MIDREDAAREAVRAAVACRRRLGIPREAPLSPLDAAERLGVEVRFTDASSLEGMYARDTQTVLIAAQRPLGRQAFTCAHELGHWYFDHGTRVDNLGSEAGQYTPEEWMADVFASYFLMPGAAIRSALIRRGWDPEKLDSFQAWTLASQFGVGLETLLSHLCKSLRLITERHYKALLKVTPKDIRKSVLGVSTAVGHLAVMDASWSSLPLDLRVGDAALLPAGSVVEGQSVRMTERSDRGVLASAVRSGLSRVLLPGGGTAVFARVSRSAYTGRATWRHLEDPDAA